MKVGKAIYNILSQSTDVQSNFPFNTTDYSPTGTDLVTNGDFDAGVEKVLNGNFTNGTTNWTNEASSTISVGTHFGKNDVAKIEITAATTADRITQPFTFVDGGSYKVTVEVYLQSGSFRVDTADTIFPNDFFITTTTGSWQTLTGYFTTISGGLNKIFVRANSEISEFYVNTISIEELGEGWTFFGVDATNTISIESGGARVIAGANISLRQTILEVGKHYKLTCDTAITSGALGLDSYTAGTTTNFTEGANVVYFTAAATLLIIKRITGADNVLIDNITVQEMALNKIFPELAPPDIDAPYIVYSVVSNSPSETKNANGDIDTASIEVYGFQDTYNKAVDLGVSVRAALDRKTGTYNTIEIQSTNYVNEQMDVNEARKLWAAIQDYSIRIKNI